MRSWMAAGGVVCALVGLSAPASAQFGVGDASSAGSSAMPGLPVGTVVKLSPAATEITKAVPQAGNPIGTQGRIYDPSRPLDVFKGTNIDPSNVIAPVAGYSGTGSPNLLTQLYTKIGSIVGLSRTVTTGPVPNVTPGIFRRNRERAAARMWRAD